MRSMSFLIILFACFAIGSVPQESVDVLSKATETFAQANEAQPQEAKELYLKAASLYEQLAGGGIENSKLYYNIANSYLLADDLGRAIFYYKKALHLDPADPQINRNLAVARSKRLDKVEVQTEKKVLATLFFWHYDFSLPVRFIVSIIALSSVLILATVRVWVSRFGVLLPLISIALLVLLCAAISVAVEVYNSNVIVEGVIVADAVNARKGDSERYEVAFTRPLHSGTEFVLIEERFDWLNVQLADGSKIWLPADSCMIDK